METFTATVQDLGSAWTQGSGLVDNAVLMSYNVATKGLMKMPTTKPKTHKKIARVAPSDDVVRARINKSVKREATKVLAEIGLTPSSAYRMLMVRIAREKALPFNPHVPNAKTKAALDAASSGKVTKSNSIDDLFEDLNADD